MPETRLSIVVTSRNDDFGGDMLLRLRLFVDTLAIQAENHGLRAELIIVEWNPPPGRRLYDELASSIEPRGLPIRFIEVPPEAHSRFRNADVLPLFQMIAKNVGIRRARGEFVLATNQDILFSDELVGFLAKARLESNAMYRIDRTDVEAGVPEEGSVQERMTWCETHPIRVHRRSGTLPHPRGIRLIGFQRFFREFLAAHPPGKLLMASLRYPLTYFATDRSIHTNACGDFTLCAREHWHDLRGYAELAIYSLHIDSLFCYTASAAGLAQQMLRRPLRLYHLEHASSWAVMAPAEKLRWFSTKPWLDWSVVKELCDEMCGKQEPTIFNDENWGLGDWQLDEVALQDGAVRRDSVTVAAAGTGS